MSRFASSVSTARFRAFPCKMTYRGCTIAGSSTSIKTGAKLQEGGFTFSHDGIARIPLAVAPSPGPRIGEELVVFIPGGPIAGQRVQIDEILNHPNNPEWRLGLSCV